MNSAQLVASDHAADASFVLCAAHNTMNKLSDDFYSRHCCFSCLMFVAAECRSLGDRGAHSAKVAVQASMPYILVAFM